MHKYQTSQGSRSYYMVTMLVIGLLLIGSGVYVEYGQLRLNFGSFVLEYWIISLFLMVLGASALVVCLASSILLKETKDKLNDMLEKKLDRFQKVQIDFLKYSFSVTGQALTYKLKDILDPRYRLVTDASGQRGIEPNPHTFDALAKHIRSYVKEFMSSPTKGGQKDKMILINGITLKDIVDPGNSLSASITQVVKELSYESRKRNIGNQRLVIRALMLSPQSDATDFRKSYRLSKPNIQTAPADEEIETFFQRYPLQDQTNSESESVGERLHGDIEYSVRAFRNLAHIIETKRSLVKLELKQTVVLPPAYFIMTEDYIFIEQYHLGRENINDTYKCLVGTMPMFQFSAGSPVYENMRKHFEFLWTVDSNKELNQTYRVETLI